jgi:hypothetical protein
MPQGNFADAVVFAEETYDCVAVLYNPVHPFVQVREGSCQQTLLHLLNMYVYTYICKYRHIYMYVYVYICDIDRYI